MKKYEVLSPVGDVNGFYTAIKSGADAVYMGLPKFNARMKADNISLDILPDLVRYAHLRDVKVYITLNTLLTDKEILTATELVRHCLLSKVDAFIVQDLGLITHLKNTFPDITLHGSTQLGVHNVRGARMAKSLGLSRVVLSRECTLRDIEEIAHNVDIELEVFVQGAMCVAFSGNCYMSSLKHNASGNRGECKQLCRLDYTLSDERKSLKGYALSPRDNCMIDKIPALCDIGVVSFKIEGRLRHCGYIAVATNVYREAIDSYINKQKFDSNAAREKLRRVFSRGEFIAGYNDSNNIIDTINNNHIGVKIGKCVSSTKFKDLYKITIESSIPINSGDGLKFINNNSTISMGVGNIDKNGNKYIVYGKNFINAGSIVYKTLDSELESNTINYTRKRPLDISIEALCGNRLMVRYATGDCSVVEYGAVCESANKAPLSEEMLIKSFSKIDHDVYDIRKTECVTDGVFVVVSQINELRRNAIAKLEEKILGVDVVEERVIVTTDNSPVSEVSNSYAIVDEITNLNTLNQYDGVILSPTEYSFDVIDNFYNKSKKYFSTILLNLPLLARVDDLRILDNIVSRYKDRFVFVANNIYALDYLKEGARLLAGSGLNIVNNYSRSFCEKFGCSEIIGSIEKWPPRLQGTYKMSSNLLMTFAHCPYKTLYNNSCGECKCNGKLSLQSTNGKYSIYRQKIANCNFELIENRPLSYSERTIVDVR